MSVSKEIQYPPQTGPYKVFVKDKGIWKAHSTARLQISVGNPKHDGDKFYALTEWAAARFDHVVLIVSDTLQRHNIALSGGVKEQEAYDLSLKRGDEWLLRNKPALDILPNKTVTRWDEWLSHPDYSETYDAIRSLYECNQEFRDAVRGKAVEFARRNTGLLNESFPSARFVENSVNYILEEVPAFAIMFRADRAIDVYPGEWFKDVFDNLQRLSDQKLLSGFRDADCLRVDFTRNKSFGLQEERQAA